MLRFFLVPFESRLVKNQSYSESLKIGENDTFMPSTGMKYWYSKGLQRLIIDKFGLKKKDTKRSVKIVLQIFERYFSKIFRLTWITSHQKFIQYLHMQYILWIYWCVINCILSSPYRPLIVISCSNIEIVLSNIWKTAPLKDMKAC